MIIRYNDNEGLMYIIFSKCSPSIRMTTSNRYICKFVAKDNKDKIIGYEIKRTEDNIKKFLNSAVLNRKQKLAIVMSHIRKKKRKTQEEFSATIHLSSLTYYNIERAKHNIAFSTLDKIYNQLQDEKTLHCIF